jgi:hypothetical protein
MPLTDIRRAALTTIITAAIIMGPALGADQTGVQSVQYRSAEGVEYRSLPDTTPSRAREPLSRPTRKTSSKIIDLGVAQSGRATVSRSHRDVHAGARDRAEQRAAAPMARASISIRT